jgi:transposase InsO family protein
MVTVIDCFSKEVIGWATGDNYNTPLIEKAIEMAVRNHLLAENAIFHSDRGSNYRATSKVVFPGQRLLRLAGRGVRRNCLDRCSVVGAASC